ncbi:MAG: hypothetical protein K8R69_04355 [Deltaproteobacteria bacterium]|nr:hypothetical protein [Deltaproteobacteria bacterium]
MKKLLTLLLALSLGLAACTGRVPSQAKTAHIAQKYFKKYGKKYKESPFAANPVTTVEVKDIQELQKDISTSFLILKLTDGSEVPVIMTLIRKPPLGWRTSSWEMAHQ